ncbi:MAG: hypothetical protein WBO31_11240, partial [Saprospiraceae bacterium]
VKSFVQLVPCWVYSICFFKISWSKVQIVNSTSFFLPKLSIQPKHIASSVVSMKLLLCTLLFCDTKLAIQIFQFDNYIVTIHVIPTLF